MAGRNGRNGRPLRSPVQALDENAIGAKRAECMREIERLRATLGSTPFVDKAYRLLLPRYWAAATWKGRADILKTVEWLIAMSVGVGTL
jgi:hypothetical protein